MIEVYVSDLAFDTLSNSPVVLLKAVNSTRVLPIWIGQAEAGVIAMEMSGMKYKRPLTHDLLKSVMNGFNAVLQKVVITAIKNNTFFARFFILASESEIIEIDARPSDSIAMALKMKAPIYVSDDLDEQMIEFSVSDEEEDSESIDSPFNLKKRLKNIRPEDFGDIDE